MLHRCGPDKVRHAPFHHIVREELFDADLYRRLSESFPADEIFLDQLSVIRSNQAIRIAAADVIGNRSFSPEWRDFFEYHTSEAFWRDIVNVFGDGIREVYPDIEAKAGRPISDWRVKSRAAGSPAEVSLDLLFVINTPVTTPSSVRPAHVDRRNKIFSGLFYMKKDGDPTPGGDLALSRFKTGKRGFGGHYAEAEDIEQTDLIAYGSNKFVGFINSPESIHGVTPRPATDWTRRYINFVVETPFEAFELPRLPVSRRIAGWVRRKKAKSPGVDVKLDVKGRRA